MYVHPYRVVKKQVTPTYLVWLHVFIWHRVEAIAKPLSVGPLGIYSYACCALTHLPHPPLHLPPRAYSLGCHLPRSRINVLNYNKREKGSELKVYSAMRAEENDAVQHGVWVTWPRHNKTWQMQCKLQQQQQQQQQ